MFYWLIVWREQYVNRSYGSYENVSHLVGWWLVAADAGCIGQYHPWCNVRTCLAWTQHPPGSGQEWLFSAKIKPWWDKMSEDTWYVLLADQPRLQSHCLVLGAARKSYKVWRSDFLAWQHFYKGDMALKWYENIHDLTRVIVGRWTDMSSCPGKSASRGGDGATAAWRNALATNEPQIKPGPENNNNYHGQHHTRNLTWVLGITSRARNGGGAWSNGKGKW